MALFFLENDTKEIVYPFPVKKPGDKNEDVARSIEIRSVGLTGSPKTHSWSAFRFEVRFNTYHWAGKPPHFKVIADQTTIVPVEVSTKENDLRVLCSSDVDVAISLLDKSVPSVLVATRSPGSVPRSEDEPFSVRLQEKCPTWKIPENEPDPDPRPAPQASTQP